MQFNGSFSVGALNVSMYYTSRIIIYLNAITYYTRTISTHTYYYYNIIRQTRIMPRNIILSYTDQSIYLYIYNNTVGR